MSESDIQSAEPVDNWVFDSLVNFLHGSIWKVPVVGFIEEKSVVFDPDSYNNMTEEKEEEFRKIHEEYKSVVDFMLASFMEDLQVSPEQVEDACRVREHRSKILPESHITKVALEQLWAAEDFTAFRRLMTRKNIDLQLQSLELLVAKYGVLSPSLRSGDSEDVAKDDDGEDDFLQVVIRYSDQLELFKCDYGTEERSPGSSRNKCKPANDSVPEIDTTQEESKNMKVHLAGIQFKNNVAPTPANYHATLSSSSTSASKQSPSSPNAQLQTTSIPSPTETEGKGTSEKNSLEEPNENLSTQASANSSQQISPNTSPSEIVPEPDSAIQTSSTELTQICKDDADICTETEKREPEKQAEPEDSQLIQLEEAEAAIDEESGLQRRDEPLPEDQPVNSSKEETQASAPTVSGRFDEKTAVEIASTASEQRRLLTAVRKALEVNPEDPGSTISIDMSSCDKDEDIQKRREYLRAQRDKLIAMKKQEREKLLAKTSEGQQSSRPKSARAAQIALKNPSTMRAASINEKSLSARRALADRLKQELIEK